MLQILKNYIHFLTALLAVFFYGSKASKMTVIGITGTDGKTSTTELLYHILLESGKKVSMISTVRAVLGGNEYDTGFHVTTPSPFTLQKYIKKAYELGSRFLVLEVTSHALDQARTTGTSIDIAVITNISHEHIDYHKTFENYKEAKAKILKGVKYSILNADDKNFDYFQKKADGKIITFGLGKKADFTKESFPFKSTLIGDFNDYNILAATAVTKQIGLSDNNIKSAISSFKGVMGRMEEIKTGRNFRIFLDFAHKINALENALETVKKEAKRKVIVVFGSAGLRDVIKRPIMGKIAGKLADFTILTAEDPRTEDVRTIIDQIAKGVSSAGAKELDKSKPIKITDKNKHFFWRIPDRQEAINFAIRKLAQAGDVVLITGEGHEKSMCYGTVEYPWSDTEAIHKALHDNVSKT